MNVKAISGGASFETGSEREKYNESKFFHNLLDADVSGGLSYQ